MWLHTPDPQTALQQSLLFTSSQTLAPARHLLKGRAIWGFGRRKKEQLGSIKTPASPSKRGCARAHLQPRHCLTTVVTLDALSPRPLTPHLASPPLLVRFPGG